METKTLEWWKCSIAKQEMQKRAANNDIMYAVISSDAIQCLQKNGFYVEKIVPCATTKRINITHKSIDII